MASKEPNSSSTAIIVAILGMIGVICAATVSLGLPFSQRIADTIFPPTSTPFATSTPIPTSTPFPTTSPLNFMASLSSNVQDLRFYESGDSYVPIDQRAYSTSFNSETTRYVNWELNLDHQQAGQRINFIIHAVYYKSNGTTFHEQDFATYVESDWPGSYHNSGLGWREGGNWEKGAYTVVLYVSNVEVARASFQVR